MDKVEFPFTPDQVASLNAYQLAGVMRPFTCGADDCHGIRLIAAGDGWHCASQTCDYRQDWAHAAESLEIANETFDAVVQSWPKE